MRRLELLGLAMLAALAVAGCGSGSSSTPMPTNPEHVTTAAQVAAMEKRFEEAEELRPVYKEEAAICKESRPRYEWEKECLAPLQSNLARLNNIDEKLAHELMLKAGQGCREALKAGFVFDRIEEQTIAACKADIGKRADEEGGE